MGRGLETLNEGKGRHGFVSVCGLCLRVRDLRVSEVDENKSMGRDSGGGRESDLGDGFGPLVEEWLLVERKTTAWAAQGKASLDKN